jgi:cell division protein FtsB
MSKRSPAVALLEPSSPDQEPESVRNRTLLVVVMGGTALLILFAWLHLIVSTQITSTGRAIQEARRELARLERENEMVVREIAVAEAQQAMAERAAALGYGPQAPLYLALPDLGSGGLSLLDTGQPQADTPGLSSTPAAAGLAAAGASARNPASQYLLQGGSGQGEP